MTMKLADREVKETIAKMIDKKNVGRDEKYKDRGVGLNKTVKDRGAGPGETVKGKGANQGQDTGDIDGSHYYPLVGPRPEDAPDIDNSTVVQCTGAERSPVHPLDVMDNTLYSQHLEDGKSNDVRDASGRGTRQGEEYEGGGGGRSTKMKGAGRNGDVYKGGGAGLSAMMKDKGAGRKDDVHKDEGAGLGAKKKDKDAGR